MEIKELIQPVVGFAWDKGNISKNWIKHRVSPSECEDVFFNRPLVEIDHEHSQQEERYFAYGITNTGRLLFIVFTLRKNKIRVISAKKMIKKERRIYYEKIKENT